MNPHADGASPPMGIQLDHVYDGISVWQMPDGSLINRWDKPLADAVAEGRHRDVPILRRRRDLTDAWIIRRDRADWSNGAPPPENEPWNQPENR